MSSTGWVNSEGDIGIPAKGLFVIAFTLAGYLGICGVLHVALARLNEGKGPPSTDDTLLVKLQKSPSFWYRLLFVILAAAVGGSQIGGSCGRSGDSSYCWNWHLMYWYSLLLIVTANISSRPHEFYMGEGVTFKDTLRFYLQNQPMPSPEEVEERVREKYLKTDAANSEGGIGFWVLMPSAFITWIFAKSIRNSSVLGGRFGMLGGFAYDSWYLSFFSSAIVCYILRTRYKFQSLPTAVYKNYGPLAVFCFQLCVLFRLFNEVWSNATVIGLFYGSSGSSSYWGACWFSVLVPATYVVMGGMRSSLFSDVFQAGLAVLFLVVVLSTIASDRDFSNETNAFEYSPPTSLWGVDGWQPGWWAYIIAGSIGGMISYPYFDPVLTDRCFLGKPKTMLVSFFVGGLLAMLFIFFYAVIGVYGAWLKVKYTTECGCTGGMKAAAPGPGCPADWNPCSKLVGSVGEASDVAWLLGRRTYVGAEIFINLVMISASLSTLDSTFTSASKLVSLEFCGWLKLSGDTRSLRGPLRPIDLPYIGSAHMSIARAFILFLAFVGTAFLGYEKDAMKATTVAGMSIMGIGMPIWWMTIWRTKQDGRQGWRQAPLAFIVPFVVGWFYGISYYIHGEDNTDRKTWCAANAPTDATCVVNAQGWTYDLNVGTYTTATGAEAQNAYGRYLGTMMQGHAVVIALFFLFFALHQVVAWTPEVEPENEEGTVMGYEAKKVEEPPAPLEEEGVAGI